MDVQYDMMNAIYLFIFNVINADVDWGIVFRALGINSFP